MINIINYGLNNIFSIKNCLDKINVNSKIIDTPQDFKEGNKIILPGVGSFKIAMNKLKKNHWDEFLKNYLTNKNNYLLGICLGMQLLASKSSEDGKSEGLNLVNCEVKKLSDMNCNERLPHVGWNSLKFVNHCSIFKNIPDNLDFYFVHNYIMTNNKYVVGEFEYGLKFTAAIQNNNIFGVQFHPEKSADAGKIILKNFNDL